MKRVTSVLAMSLLLPAFLQSQERPNRFSRSSAPSGSAYASFAPRSRSWTEKDSIAAKKSHAVRNGAIVGAIVGVVAGGYGGGVIVTGCKPIAAPPGQPQPECHSRSEHNKFIIAGAAVGGFAAGLVGAVAGKLWQLLD